MLGFFLVFLVARTGRLCDEQSSNGCACSALFPPAKAAPVTSHRPCNPLGVVLPASWSPGTGAQGGSGGVPEAVLLALPRLSREAQVLQVVSVRQCSCANTSSHFKGPTCLHPCQKASGWRPGYEVPEPAADPAEQFQPVFAPSSLERCSLARREAVVISHASFKKPFADFGNINAKSPPASRPGLGH